VKGGKEMWRIRAAAVITALGMTGGVPWALRKIAACMSDAWLVAITVYLAIVGAFYVGFMWKLPRAALDAEPAAMSMNGAAERGTPVEMPLAWLPRQVRKSRPGASR